MPSPDLPPATAVSALAVLLDGQPSLATRLHLDGGDRLIAPGDAPAAIYLLRRGLLAATRVPEGTLLGLIHPGEPVGEMAVLAGTDHVNEVTAVRDSVVDALPAERFIAEAARRPELMAEVARHAVTRARAAAPAGRSARAVLIASLSPGLDPRPLAARIVASCAAQGIAATRVDSGSGTTGAWLGAAEREHGLVVISAGHGEDDWAATCRRQVDRVLLLARPDDPPPPDCALCESEPLQRHQLVDLVLERGDAAGDPARWCAATKARRVFHVGADASGVDRLARILTGTSVALVLSGGGARAFAHVGVVAALREAGVPIDLVAGTSMGAIVAAGVASGWDARELDARLRRAFVETNPLDDIALPILAMTRGRKVEARLREHFGDTRIEALAIPFFCVSADLNAGRHVRHDRGNLAHALRASISLPGILPPVIDGDRVLVDGGVLRNLPTDVMRTMHEGTVIGSDVTRDVGLMPAGVASPPSWLRWFSSGAWRGGPPIVSVLIRSATVANAVEIAAARDASDVYIMPELADVEIRDWAAYPRAVAAGRAAAEAVLAQRPPALVRTAA